MRLLDIESTHILLRTFCLIPKWCTGKMHKYNSKKYYIYLPTLRPVLVILQTAHGPTERK